VVTTTFLFISSSLSSSAKEHIYKVFHFLLIFILSSANSKNFFYSIVNSNSINTGRAMSTISSSTFYPNEDISRITITNNNWLISYTSFIYLTFEKKMLIRNGASGTFTSFDLLVYYILCLPKVLQLFSSSYSFFLSLCENIRKMAIKIYLLMNFNDASQLNAINFLSLCFCLWTMEFVNLLAIFSNFCNHCLSFQCC